MAIHWTAPSDSDPLPAYPPADYQGSVAAWCIAMGQRGYPEDYADLCDTEVPNDVWWEVLEECEGVPAGECSVHCDDNHHPTCRLDEKVAD